MKTSKQNSLFTSIASLYGKLSDTSGKVLNLDDYIALMYQLAIIFPRKFDDAEQARLDKEMSEIPLLMQQVQLALKKANPEAFTGENSNMVMINNVIRPCLIGLITPEEMFEQINAIFSSITAKQYMEDVNLDPIVFTGFVRIVKVVQEFSAVLSFDKDLLESTLDHFKTQLQKQ